MWMVEIFMRSHSFLVKFVWFNGGIIWEKVTLNFDKKGQSISPWKGGGNQENETWKFSRQIQVSKKWRRGFLGVESDSKIVPKIYKIILKIPKNSKPTINHEKNPKIFLCTKP